MIRKVLLSIFTYVCALGIVSATSPFSPQEQAAWAASTTPEALQYNIYFHMGFIRTKAGAGKLNFKRENNRKGQTIYHGQLTGRSLSIVEHIMKVRDTLDCWFNEDMVPMAFRKGTHEGSYNALANYSYSPCWHNPNAPHRINNVDSTKVVLKRWRKKGSDPAVNKEVHYSNTGLAYDMLSVFYSVRHLDYANMKRGTKMEFCCYDGTEQQTIRVEYRGKEKCELRTGQTYDSYLIHLTFNTKGQDDTPLKVWLATSADHRPVKAIIGLRRIGSVRCEIQE